MKAPGNPGAFFFGRELGIFLTMNNANRGEFEEVEFGSLSCEYGDRFWFFLQRFVWIRIHLWLRISAMNKWFWRIVAVACAGFFTNWGMAGNLDPARFGETVELGEPLTNISIQHCVVGIEDGE